MEIAYGQSVNDTNWTNINVSWEDFCQRLLKEANENATKETHAEYMAMSKDDQNRIKDFGGYVGGHLKSGRRKKDSVDYRSMLTLDADYAPLDFMDDLQYSLSCAYAVHSTHKHCPEKPRLRVLIPLDRNVTPDEYEAISRKVAEWIGIEYFDDTAYRVNQLMFWPSHSRDIEPVCEAVSGEFLKADDVLNEYPDWTDTSSWPVSSRSQKKIDHDRKKQGDPLEKPGWIGAFNKTYTVTEAIEKFIPDEYIPCDQPDRYTYAHGSTSAGLVIYDNDTFAYSNHSTDPASGILCSAFDLVRIHKFGDLDDDLDEDTPIEKRESQAAMLKLAEEDPQTKSQLFMDTVHGFDDFEDEDDPESGDWIEKLEFVTRGKETRFKNSLQNLLLILKNDERLKGIAFNQLGDGIEIKGSVPWNNPSRYWRDEDDDQLYCYIDTVYKTFTKYPKDAFNTAVTKVTDDRRYHPIRDYFKSLPDWDGVERVDTLLIDYLGAEDSPYVRAITRKELCAGYMRVHKPGVKFDTMIVLNGAQGIGKSTLLEKLGGEWYSDSLNLTDCQDKTAAEKLQGYWIVEIGELAGMRKSDTNKVKAFLTRSDDKYRASYGRRVTRHPRQCILFGTTNDEDGYLRDTTGNRRYWPVRLSGEGKYKPWDLTEDTVKQIWAEVMVYAKAGEKLFLPPELEKYAVREQRAAMEHDDREGLVETYLDMMLPNSWDEKSIYERQTYFKSDLKANGSVRRSKVCYAEIFCECFCKQKEDMTRSDSYEIKRILAAIGGWKRDKLQNVKHYGKQWVFVRDE